MTNPDGPRTNCTAGCSGYASGGVPNETCNNSFGAGPEYNAGDVGSAGGGSVAPGWWSGGYNTADGCWTFTDGQDCFNGVQVAVQPGSPKAGETCGLNDGQQSLAIGTTVGSVNVNGQSSLRSVVDVTAIYSYGGSKIKAPNFLYNNLKPVGWVYTDNNGAFWFQKDANTNWTVTFGGSASLGSIFGVNFGITPPNDETSVALGSKPGKIGNHLVAGKCWANDSSIYPGELAGVLVTATV